MDMDAFANLGTVYCWYHHGDKSMTRTMTYEGTMAAIKNDQQCDTPSIPDRLTIADVENIISGAKNAQNNPAWKDIGVNVENMAKQLADTMRDLNGILENVPEAAKYHEEREQWNKDSDNA